MSELLNPSASDDFEWVNAWAAKFPTAMPDPKAAPAAKQEPASVAETTTARDPDAPLASVPPTDPQGTAADASPPAPRKLRPDPDMFVSPATRRFFASFRAPPPEAVIETPPPAPVPSLQSAADAPAPAIAAPPAAVVHREPAAVESSQVSLVPEGDMLERDIAEIERVRDALLAQPQFNLVDPRKVRGPFAVLRNGETVPIVIGTVVGLTLLIVFGAAASLISLR